MKCHTWKSYWLSLKSKFAISTPHFLFLWSVSQRATASKNQYFIVVMLLFISKIIHFSTDIIGRRKWWPYYYWNVFLFGGRLKRQSKHAKPRCHPKVWINSTGISSMNGWQDIITTQPLAIVYVVDIRCAIYWSSSALKLLNKALLSLSVSRSALYPIFSAFIYLP